MVPVMPRESGSSVTADPRLRGLPARDGAAVRKELALAHAALQRERSRSAALEEALRATRRELDAIVASHAWRAARLYYRVRDGIPLLRALRRGALALAILPRRAPARAPAARPGAEMPRFRALLAARHASPDLDAERDPLRRMYIDFALSTVARGREVVGTLEAARVPIAGRRYLDAGCAYGGFLVAFHEAGAREVRGVDYVPEYLDYAREVLADHALPPTVEHADLLDRATVDRLGTFDLVTANDVIEHVGDARLGLERLVALTAPGGYLFLQIPNRFWPPFLRSDGHYQLFGLSALPKGSADAYSRAIRGSEQDVTYHQLGYYLGHLARLGVEARVLDAPPGDLAAALEAVGRELDETERVAVAAPVAGDPALHAEARRRVLRLARVFRKEQERFRALLTTDEVRAEALGRRLVLAFGVSFWRVLVHRPAGV
jgi:2-polyprenyl-3-methyl-5-hydroxy-6-metoxy-1,4-benzoquinol methylase